MNVTVISGRFTKDPEVRVSAGSNPVAIARFTLAVDREFKRDGQPTADFIACRAVGKTAEFIEKYFTKGMKAEVRGSWQTGSYKKDDGTTVYTNDCFVEAIHFAESKNSQNSSPAPTKTDEDGFMNFDGAIPEELPFV